MHGEVTLAELRDDHGIDVDHPDLTTIAGLVLIGQWGVRAAGACGGTAYEEVREQLRQFALDDDPLLALTEPA